MPSGGCEEPDSVFSQGSRGATARRQSRSTALGRGTVRHCWRQGGERGRDFSGRHENRSPQSPLPRSPTSRRGRSPRFRTRRRLKKLLHLVTGPSGSGKTTFCLSQADWVHHRHNMDELSEVLRSAGTIEHKQDAWPFLVRSLQRQLDAGASPVCMDHVFDRSTFSPIATPARRLGYHLCLWVVSPSSPETCVARVQKRRSEGGHGLKNVTVRSLFGRALLSASRLCRYCDDTYLVDSDDAIEVLVRMQGQRAVVRNRQRLPAWIQDHFLSSCKHIEVLDESHGFEVPRP